MRRTRILLGITGSVASTLTGKIAYALNRCCHAAGEGNEVRIVTTEKALPFLNEADVSKGVWPSHAFRYKESTFELYSDESEWSWPRGSEIVYNWQKNDPIIHIDLRKWADALVIAPLSANTLAKMANGLCDNLLTSIVRAWDWHKPLVVAPAMNTFMWESPFTAQHLKTLTSPEFGVVVVPPTSKELACGDVGDGALADINDIVAAVEDQLYWQFPLKRCYGVPVDNHPGAFGYRRKHSYHTGVDLYTDEGQQVHAVESGVVVSVEHFTGPQDNSPWWNNTEAVCVEGKSGVICYGEIRLLPESLGGPCKGKRIKRGDVLGYVTPVLLEGKERPDIPGHSRSMLHLELYTADHRECSHSWHLDSPKHDYLLNPTPLLLESKDCPKLLSLPNG